MNRRLGSMLAATLLVGAASAQQIRTFTESQTGPNFLPYGLPVPQPIDSLTPVDGFRSYASLEARLQGMALGSSDLSAHDVGRTTAGRTVWAYVVGDEDGNDVEGRPEAAFFINATTHAREWAAPEVATGTIERLIDSADDGGWTRYLLDNTRLVIIPVHNIDGFRQAQRYPTEAIVGQDPTVPSEWPRDGRMRRKNMRGVDEVLTTFNDHLLGIDLNRNHPPFWASSSQSTANPAGLTHHGSAAQSEPETQALVNAAQLGPETRFRLGIDVHTFSRVFFSSNTARERLNAIQSRLIGTLAMHHLDVAGKQYTDVPDPPNVGIGAAAEYFAYRWLVPAWTLELEPLNNAREYGGTTVTHGGFILPASQARRVREGWAETHAVASYMMAGPPHLARMRVFDRQSGELVSEQRWYYDPQTARRNLVTLAQRGLQPGARYRAELGFSKPMRRRDAGGTIRALTGLSIPDPAVALVRDGQRTPLSTTGGTWINDLGRVVRYRDDTFAFEFDAPGDVANYQVEVDARDMTNLALDSDPSTPADWAQGAWSEYEDASGSDGDVGGVDRLASLRVQQGSAARLVVLEDWRVVGEGDRTVLRLSRTQAGPERVEALLYAYDGTFPGPSVVATWAAGEGGERSVFLPFGENLDVDGDRDVVVRFDERVDGAFGTTHNTTYRLLDNDASDLAVFRQRQPESFLGAWNFLSSGTPARSLVLDGGQTFTVPLDDGTPQNPGLDAVESTMSVFANGATLQVPEARSRAAAISVAAGGRLTLDKARLRPHQPLPFPLPDAPSFASDGDLVLQRSAVTTGSRLHSELVAGSGSLRIERSLLRDVSAESVATFGSGQVRVSSSTFSRNMASNVIGASTGGAFLGSTVIENNVGFLPFMGASQTAPRSFGHTLIQNNIVSGSLSPPILENCEHAGQSLGFNVENYIRCGFTQPTDRSGIDLGDFTFDPKLGGYAPIGAAIDGGATAAQAEATGCGKVDQRGAPRPQTLTSGAEPRCDIGAIELGVNPYRGIWAPTRAGHGIDVQTSGNTLLLAWYTYGDDGQPTAYQAAAALTGRHWEADLLQPRRDPQSGAISTPKVGRVSLDFASDVAARLGWRFDARGTNGSEEVRPALFANGEPRFEVTGLWYAPQDSGWGATISRRAEVTVLGLYYYDAQGAVRWALGSANAADAAEFQMLSYTGFCPDCDAAQMPVSSRPAGSVLAHFHTPERARLDTQLTYPGAAGGQWIKQTARIVPLNDAVDNRYPLGTLP
ncbi:MAG: M14 family metallopeptidase [Chiayiivirga sp.]|jgi:hypothetical protein|uniref:M14 family metallopeptidase n=1 Tax=Chiayiivirga sp. TaxID=2041042 RepID=UPI0025BD4889|nr:M14 family metallopeptidase [Chiayiivirga sp.]MCI1730155.1 M14 family metallopeptidase [Chiayiivirga sp.]